MSARIMPRMMFVGMLLMAPLMLGACQTSSSELEQVDMGEIQRPTTLGYLEKGEAHVYTYVRESSGGYATVSFALTRESGSLDPYLTVKVDGRTLVENDDSYLAEDFPGAARAPEHWYFCVDRGAPAVTFEVIVRDASGKGSGDYELSTSINASIRDAGNCQFMLPSQ